MLQPNEAKFSMCVFNARNFINLSSSINIKVAKIKANPVFPGSHTAGPTVLSNSGVPKHVVLVSIIHCNV